MSVYVLMVRHAFHVWRIIKKKQKKNSKRLCRPCCIESEGLFSPTTVDISYTTTTERGLILFSFAELFGGRKKKKLPNKSQLFSMKTGKSRSIVVKPPQVKKENWWRKDEEKSSSSGITNKIQTPLRLKKRDKRAKPKQRALYRRSLETIRKQIPYGTYIYKKEPDQEHFRVVSLIYNRIELV